MLESYVKRILAARVYDVAEESRLVTAPLLSARLGNHVLLKREDEQQVFSFKLRGAYNRMSKLTPEQRAKGVVTASAGNHAQGVALGAAQLGIRAVVVMGVNTPEIKVNAVRARGAKVILQGDTYDDAALFAQGLVQEHGYTYVHPYDDPDVIAGQGTIGMEILRQFPTPDAIFVPVGGGGLIAGIAAYVKYVRPQTLVIGVEAEGSACLTAALRAKRRVRLPAETLDIFADGVSVAQIGEETFRICREHVDLVVTASTDEIRAAIKDAFDDTRSVMEPAGALSIAGMKTWVSQNNVRNKTLVAILSGANLNFDRLRYVSERADIGEGREVVLAVTIPEQPGAFRKFCRVLGKRNVTEFNYRYADSKQAQVFVGLSVAPGGADRTSMVAGLQEAGYLALDFTDNEMAKLHVRHMVGGRADVADEVIYRFQFPERPGALMKFLNVLGDRWNISMFHYRNHGSAWGRVLAGFQVPAKQRKALNGYLDEVGYLYWDETENTAYQRFLR